MLCIVGLMKGSATLYPPEAQEAQSKMFVLHLNTKSPSALAAEDDDEFLNISVPLLAGLQQREIYIDSSHGGLMTMAGVQNPSVQNQQ